MTEPVISTKSDDVSVTLALAADALAAARQRAMPSAAEAAGALILGAFEGGVSTDIDIDLRVPIAYARGAAAWLVTEGVGVPWGSELQGRCDLLAPVLDTVRAAFTPATAQPPQSRQRKPNRPTLARVAKQAEQAGIPVAGYEVKRDGSILVVTGTTESNRLSKTDDPISVVEKIIERRRARRA